MRKERKKQERERGENRSGIQQTHNIPEFNLQSPLLILTEVELIPPHRPLSEEIVTTTFFLTSTPNALKHIEGKYKIKVNIVYENRHKYSCKLNIQHCQFGVTWRSNKKWQGLERGKELVQKVDSRDQIKHHHKLESHPT